VTAKITPLCQDDLLNDGPPKIDRVNFLLVIMNPFHLTLLIDHVQCFAKTPFFYVLPLKFRKIFLSDLTSNFRLVSGVGKDRTCIFAW